MRWIFAAAFAALLSAPALHAAENEAPILRFVGEGVGTLTIEPDGTVSDATLPEDLQPELRDAYAAEIRRWTFEPIVIDGAPVRALGHMLVVFSIELKGRAFHRASIERVTFTDPAETAASAAHQSDSVSRMRPPAYPMELARQGIGGEVMLAIETDSEGRVLRAAPQAGQLYRTVRRSEEAAAQRAFASLVRASVSVAKNWQVSGCRATVCSVPVRFWVKLDGSRESFWKPAHAVPVTPEAWMLGAGVMALGADGAVPSPRFQLKTKIDGIDVLRAGG